MRIDTKEKSIRKYQFTEEELRNVKSDIFISDCGNYKYWLTKEWDKDLPRVMYIILNPTTADSEIDNQTLKKCIGFAKGWGYGSVEVFNLFSYITKDLNILKNIIEENGEEAAIGPENDEWIKIAVEKADLIVLAWGNKGEEFRDRTEKILNILKGKKVKCLGKTAKKQPRNPRTLAYYISPVDYIAN